MSEFPVMPLFVSDFLADTLHLDSDQVGAYTLLLCHYWKHRRGPESDLKTVYRLTRLSGRSRAIKITNVLSYFEVREGRLYHKRMEKMLAEAAEKHKRRVEAGRIGGQAKPKQCLSNAKAKGVAKRKQLDPELDSELKKPNPPIIPPKFSQEIPEQVLKDFLALRNRKKAPLTHTAIKGIEREAKKAGINTAAALEICCERGWTGFKAEWVKDIPSGKAGNPMEKLREAYPDAG